MSYFDEDYLAKRIARENMIAQEKRKVKKNKIAFIATTVICVPLMGLNPITRFLILFTVLYCVGTAMYFKKVEK